MKIVHIETGQHLYGGALQVVYLLESLAQRGVENCLICPRDSAIAVRIAHSTEPIARCYPIHFGGDADIGSLWRIARLLRRERPDLVHIHSRRGADLWGGLAAKWSRIPAVISRRVDNPEPPWLAKWKYSMYARVITISEGIRQVLIDEGIDAGHVVCVPSAVNARAYQNPCHRKWFFETFQLPAEARVFGIIAQLIARKGHRHLLDAMAQIAERCPDMHLLCLGQGPLAESLQRDVHAQGLQQRIHFAGFRDDLVKVIPCLEAVVHPALMEGLGVSLLQAGAAGKPIVATAVGGIPEIVKDKQTGLLIPPGDVDALAAAMQYMYDKPSAALRLGENARALVESRFSIGAMAAGNLAVYRSVLKAAAQ